MHHYTDEIHGACDSVCAIRKASLNVCIRFVPIKLLEYLCALSAFELQYEPSVRIELEWFLCGFPVLCEGNSIVTVWPQ